MNVEDLLRQKNIEYIPKGKDYVVRCLNPDHADRNPSMRIDQVTVYSIASPVRIEVISLRISERKQTRWK